MVISESVWDGGGGGGGGGAVMRYSFHHMLHKGLCNIAEISNPMLFLSFDIT